MKTTIDLRPLDPQQRLSTLSEAVAVNVAGWAFKPMFKDDPASTKIWHQLDDSWNCDDAGEFCGPRFSTSADAVLPWLGDDWDVRTRNGQIRVTIYRPSEQNEGEAHNMQSFAFAACIALLRMHGIEVIQ